MPRGAADTDPAAERVQLDLLRRASPARRAELAVSLSQTVVDLARADLRRRHPGASAEALGVLFVTTHYGKDLGAAVEADLARRR